MKRILLFLSISFASCMPPIQTMHEIPLIRGTLEFTSGTKQEVFVAGVDKDEIKAILPSDTLAARPLFIHKNRVKSFKTEDGKDVTQEIFAYPYEVMSAKHIERIADVQTRFYNIWIVTTVISLVGTIVSLIVISNAR